MPTGKYFNFAVILKLGIVTKKMIYFQVNCRGYNAFGRRKRSLDSENSTDLALPGDLISGQLREEITIQSNAILTFERREERFSDPKEGMIYIKSFQFCSLQTKLFSQHLSPKELKIYVYP